MMKKLLTIAAIVALPLFVKAQSPTPPMNSETNKYTYMDVVTVNQSKLNEADLYTTIQEWAKSKGYTLEKEEKDINQLTYKCSIEVSYPSTKGGTVVTGKVYFHAIIAAKSGKYRYIFTDFIHMEERGSGGELELDSPKCGINRLLTRSWAQIKAETDKKMKEEVIKGLKEYIDEVENDPSRNQDW